jgi:menaquinone-dependent protoporphyrinogen IX oxidase
MRQFLRRRDVSAVNLCEDALPEDLSLYDAFLVGGPIRHGKLHPRVLRFILDKRALLLGKTVGYFVVAGFADEAVEQIEKNIPKDLRDSAFDVVYVGGTLDVKRQKRWRDRLYVRFMRDSILDTGDGDAVEDGEFTRVLPSVNPDTIYRFTSKLN